MSLEPKKPIEELLEATARARRAEFGADPKMPNPLRTELHHEITRLSRQAERESGWRSFGISWPRLMTATALALLLVSASVIWWGREREFAGDGENEVGHGGAGPGSARAEKNIRARCGCRRRCRSELRRQQRCCL